MAEGRDGDNRAADPGPPPPDAGPGPAPDSRLPTAYPRPRPDGGGRYGERYGGHQQYGGHQRYGGQSQQYGGRRHEEERQYERLDSSTSTQRRSNRSTPRDRPRRPSRVDDPGMGRGGTSGGGASFPGAASFDCLGGGMAGGHHGGHHLSPANSLGSLGFDAIENLGSMGSMLGELGVQTPFLSPDKDGGGTARGGGGGGGGGDAPGDFLPPRVAGSPDRGQVLAPRAPREIPAPPGEGGESAPMVHEPPLPPEGGGGVGTPSGARPSQPRGSPDGRRGERGGAPPPPPPACPTPPRHGGYHHHHQQGGYPQYPARTPPAAPYGYYYQRQQGYPAHPDGGQPYGGGYGGQHGGGQGYGGGYGGGYGPPDGRDAGGGHPRGYQGGPNGDPRQYHGGGGHGEPPAAGDREGPAASTPRRSPDSFILEDALYSHDNERWNNFHPAGDAGGHSFSATPRPQGTVHAGQGPGPSPTLIDWEYAEGLFLDDPAMQNGGGGGDGNGNDDGAADGAPRDGGGTEAASPPKRKAADAGGGGGDRGDGKRARPGGTGGEVTALYSDQRYRGGRDGAAPAPAGTGGSGTSKAVITPRVRLVPLPAPAAVPPPGGAAEEDRAGGPPSGSGPPVRPPPAIQRRTHRAGPPLHPLVRTVHQPRPPSPLGNYDPELEAKLRSPPPPSSGDAGPPPSSPPPTAAAEDRPAGLVAVPARPASDPPGRMYHVYKFLKEVYPALGDCTFLLPGLAETRRRWEGGEDDEGGKVEGGGKSPCVVNVSGAGSYRVGHLPDMSVRDKVKLDEKTLSLARSRVASAICAFGGTVSRRSDGDGPGGRARPAPPPPAADNKLSIFRTRPSATIETDAPRPRARKDKRQIRREKYEKKLRQQYFEHGNRLSWDVQSDLKLTLDGARTFDDDESPPGQSRGGGGRALSRADSAASSGSGRAKTYKCRRCGQAKRGRCACPQSVALVRSIGVMAYPAANAHAADEPGSLAPPLREMNTFLLFGGDGPGAPASGGGTTPACVPVRGTGTPATPAAGAYRRRVLLSPRSARAMGVPEGEAEVTSDPLFLPTMAIDGGQRRAVTPGPAGASGYTYPEVPLTFAQRKGMSDALFSLSKMVPRLTDECALVLTEARKRDRWDLAVAELMAQVICVIYCSPSSDYRLDGVKSYLLSMGIVC